MNEEEKKAIKSMKRFVECKQDMTAVTASEMKTVLNLLEKKDKKIEDWKMEYNHWCQLAIDRKKELENKNKIIDLMAKKLNQAYFEGDNFETWFDKIMGVQEKMDYGYVVPLIKQYFERKIEK